MAVRREQETVRRTVHYRGDVQGVGFRYTARRTAAGFNVTGFVRNLSDGRVQLVAEGQMSEVEAFLEAVRDAMERHIAAVDERSSPATGEFSTFEIRHL